MRHTTKGMGGFYIYWLCCRNFPIVSSRYDADGQHESGHGAASPKQCDEDATTHEVVIMVHVLLYTHSSHQHSSIITSICEGKIHSPNVSDPWRKPAAGHLPFSTTHPRQASMTWTPTAALSGQLRRLQTMWQRGNPRRACFYFDPVLEYNYVLLLEYNILLIHIWHACQSSSALIILICIATADYSYQFDDHCSFWLAWLARITFFILITSGWGISEACHPPKKVMDWYALMSSYLRIYAILDFSNIMVSTCSSTTHSSQMRSA